MEAGLGGGDDPVGFVLASLRYSQSEVRDLRAELARREFQPIETAPKDGTPDPRLLDLVSKWLLHADLIDSVAQSVAFRQCADELTAIIGERK
jgi:hypothetical protein